jgi:hypothetical protein
LDFEIDNILHDLGVGIDQLKELKSSVNKTRHQFFYKSTPNDLINISESLNESVDNGITNLLVESVRKMKLPCEAGDFCFNKLLPKNLNINNIFVTMNDENFENLERNLMVVSKRDLANFIGVLLITRLKPLLPEPNYNETLILKCHHDVWGNLYVAVNSIYTDLMIKPEQKDFISSLSEKLKNDYKNLWNRNKDIEGLVKDHLNKYFDDLRIILYLTESELAELYDGYWSDEIDYFEIMDHIKLSKFKTIFKRFYQENPNINSMHEYEPFDDFDMKLTGNFLCKFL